MCGVFEVMERGNDRDVIENDDTDRKHVYPQSALLLYGMSAAWQGTSEKMEGIGAMWSSVV